MFAPWRQLKDAENAILAKRRAGEPVSESDWKRLAEFFDLCRMAPNAEEVLCYHGVAALLAEQNAEFDLALKHRMIEIDKIVWLQEEKRNPTDGYQTQDYEAVDLEFRREIIREIQVKIQHLS